MKTIGKEQPRYQSSYNTVIDKLVDIINKQGSLDVHELSEKTGVEPEDLEEWTKILEEKQLIKRHYPVIGPLQLMKKDYVPPKGNKQTFLIAFLAVLLLGAFILFYLITQDIIKVG